MKEQKNYQIGNDVNFKRNTEHDAALESLAKAKQREAELRAAGKLQKIVTPRGTWYASGRYVEQIQSTDFEKVRL